MIHDGGISSLGAVLGFNAEHIFLRALLGLLEQGLHHFFFLDRFIFIINQRLNMEIHFEQGERAIFGDPVLPDEPQCFIQANLHKELSLLEQIAESELGPGRTKTPAHRA
ncbi:MAG: hypothetical protein B9S28_06055 [Opitutia bacterium Tous-C10FEB]|nr:MAG: hypothetical protein B9S28_06055 [Opitutae bacterium Tous-C10FEB]